jgi:tRNA(fMet)-specific endonuclease VapC
MTKRYVLDTDILTLYQEGEPNVIRNIQARPLELLAVTIISVEQQLTGWYTKLRRAKKNDQLARAYKQMTDAVRFLVRFDILTFSEPAIVRYDGLRAAYRRLDKSDLRIAAIVLEHGDTLVTRNTRDFQQIAGLPIEDWSK